MRIPGIMVTTLAALLMVSAPAWASGNEHSGHKMKMMKEHHRMSRDTLNMLKETMIIIKGLNHKPSKADKKRLAEMIDKIEKNIARKDEMMKMMKKKHKKRCKDDGREEGHREGHDRGYDD